MAKLIRSASGFRHLRWLREIIATLEAHLELNDGLSEAQNEALAREIPILRARIEALAAAVKPYRDFLEGEHVRLRAKQRVASWLVEEAGRETDGTLLPHQDAFGQLPPGGLASLFSAPVISRALQAGNRRTAAVAGELANRLDRAGALLSQISEELATVEEPRRRPLKAAMERAITEAREAISQMEMSLRMHFPPAFIDGVYPELTRGNTVVADEADEDDDATAPPDGGR